MRLQQAAAEVLDKEFKTFLAWRGFSIDNSLFEIELTEPMNFAAYRSVELDAARIQSFSGIAPTPYLSKRFMLKKYLGLSDSEIKENETMWREESGKSQPPSAAGTDLRNVGVTPGAISGDLDNLDTLTAPGEEGLAPEGTPGQPGQSSTAGLPGTTPSPASAPTPAAGGALPGL